MVRVPAQLRQIGAYRSDVEAPRHGLDRCDGAGRHGQAAKANGNERHRLERPTPHFPAQGHVDLGCVAKADDFAEKGKAANLWKETAEGLRLRAVSGLEIKKVTAGR